MMSYQLVLDALPYFAQLRIFPSEMNGKGNILFSAKSV